MKYSYFVSYACPNGFGNCEVTAEKPLKNFDDITLLGKDIANKNGFSKTVILNFKLLNCRKHEPEGERE